MVDRRTGLFMATGLIGGLVADWPFWAWLHGDEQGWANHFPLLWIGLGMQTMSGFFHELGHSAFYWFYGYIGVPSFDFTHGGGEAYGLDGFRTPLLGALYAAIAYGLYVFRAERIIQAGLAALLILNLATVFNDVHQVVISFMGPGAQAVVGGFLLTRAWLDMAPNGALERYLNAMIGWGMIGQVFIEGWSLIHDPDVRTAYDHQKGGEDLGDFSKIADLLNINFNAAIYAWIGLGLTCAVTPFILYMLQKRQDT